MVAANLFEAYVEGRADAFFGAALGSRADRRRAVESALRPISRRVLASLRAQNERLGPSAARAAQLRALADGAAVVVTGQQVGLFLGPLFTLYKAASAISVARALAAESGRPVVPVFWLQSEDHDLPEIASCALPRAQREPLALSPPADAANRLSIGQLALPAEIAACLAALEAELGKLPHAAAHLERIKRHYRAGAGWVEAFAGLLAELFEPEGLLMIDPRDPELARESAPVHSRALDSASPLAAALLERAQALDRAGFAVTVHVRPDAPLSFYHPAGPAGPRYRLVPCQPTGSAASRDEARAPDDARARDEPVSAREAGTADPERGQRATLSEPRASDSAARAASSSAPSERRFGELGGTGQHRLSELLSALEREPRCFSTSALLRPILQDVLLPTAAYVAGPAELAYFAQLGPLYEAYGLPQPLIVPRARFRLLEPSTQRLLDRLGITPSEVEQPEAALLTQLANRTAKSAADSGADSGAAQAAPAELERRLCDGFERVLEDALTQLRPLDPQLEAAVVKTRDKLRTSAGKLAEKYASVLARQDQARVEDVRRVQWSLYPQAEPQERFYGLPYFAARYGERALIERVLTEIEPFAAARKELSL